MRSGNSSDDQGFGSAGNRSFIEAARRRQIIDAAIEVMSEIGFAKTSFARIAKRARISPSLISYHFDDKGDLVRSLAEFLNSELDTDLSAATKDLGSYREVLRGLVTGLIRYAAEHPRRMLAIHQISMGTVENPSHANVIGGETTIAEWQEFLVEGQQSGEFRDFDTRIMALSLQGVLERIPGELFRDQAVDVDKLCAEAAANVELMVVKQL